MSKKLLCAASILLAGVIANAQPQKLSDESIALLNVLSANQDAYRELVNSGNRITDATVNVRGKTTTYRITAQNCRMGFNYGCLGGATLIIKRKTMPSSPPHYEYETELLRLR